MILQSPIGKLYIDHEDGVLKEISTTPLEKSAPENPEIKTELEEYFAGRRKRFTLPINPEGTIFQIKVWEALQEIPWGETLTYGEVAAKIGKPKAARAIGQAVGQNPLLIVIPCHRVLAANGLGGFSSGVDVKIKLLEFEGVMA